MPQAKRIEEMFQPDPMFGGRPYSSEALPGGGFMEIQKGAPPSMTPEMPEIPKQLQDRNKYEKFLQSKYGDPWEDERNLPQQIDQMTRKDERDLFGHVFGNQFRYEDRRHLDTKARSHWKNALLQYRKQIEGEITTDIESRKEQMGEQMKAFDSYMKTFKEAKPPKEPTISDYDKADKMLYDISHDEEGKPIQATKASMAIAKKMFDKLEIPLIEVEVPSQRTSKWDIGEPNIPARTELQLAPQTQPETPESIKQRYKAGEISREKAIQLLQQTGM